MTNRSLNGVTVFVRKRPLFDYERKRNDYDVVSIASDSNADSDKVGFFPAALRMKILRLLVSSG